MKHNPVPGSIKRELPDSPFSPWPRQDNGQGDPITFDRQAPYIDPLERAEVSDDSQRIADFNASDATGFVDSDVPFPAGSDTEPFPLSCDCEPDRRKDPATAALYQDGNDHRKKA